MMRLDCDTLNGWWLEATPVGTLSVHNVPLGKDFMVRQVGQVNPRRCHPTMYNYALKS